jgi:hypothetical protein
MKRIWKPGKQEVKYRDQRTVRRNQSGKQEKQEGENLVIAGRATTPMGRRAFRVPRIHMLDGKDGGIKIIRKAGKQENRKTGKQEGENLPISAPVSCC